MTHPLRLSYVVRFPLPADSVLRRSLGLAGEMMFGPIQTVPSKGGALAACAAVMVLAAISVRQANALAARKAK